MRILGIDPGVATVGFGVIDSGGRAAADGPVRSHYHPGGYAAGSLAGADRRRSGAADPAIPAG